MSLSNELLEIIKHLHTISGYHISLKDVNYNTIAKYPPKNSSYCSLIQSNKQALEQCIKCDSDAYKIVSKTNEIYLYRCHAGLYEAVSPLYYFDSLSGYLVMGQMVTVDDESLTTMVKQGQKFINDKHALLNAAKNVQRVTMEKISALISIMNMCAGYITLSNRLKIAKHSAAVDAAEYINKHLTEKIKLEDLCNNCFCSKTTLSIDFKKEFGITITKYITKKRMERAAKMLKDNKNLAINYVSSKCGIDDANYFTKLFISEYGISPSKYKGYED